MTKRILNAEKSVEEPVKPKKQPVKKVPVKIWYRVAFIRSVIGDRIFPHVIDSQSMVAEVEKLPAFVRWESAVEVEV